MRLRAHFLATIAAALLGGAAPALAQPANAPASATLAPALVTAHSLPASPAVNIYYQQRGNAPIWLRDAATTAAARLLPAILERAQLDGLADGPDLARRVEAAIVRATDPPLGTQPAALLAEDKLLSAAWVQYVRALKAPVTGMIYGDPSLAPRMPKPDRILHDALMAPSLAGHVRAVTAVNPVYAQLRDAAWNKMRLGGGVAPDARLLANLERARMLPASGRHVLVNTATAQLWMYEDGKVVDTMKVVVGKRDTPTPMLAGTIHYVTFNPYWNIPTDVARTNVAPLVVKHGTDYLRTARYEVVSDWTGQATVLDPETIDWQAVAAGTRDVHIRQLPGPDNMMGALKFGFVNDLGIYLHDTPFKELLDMPKRNFSLGCVRVADAVRLARWFLGREPVAPNDDPEQYVRIEKGVPVYLTYLTAVADGGQLAFVDDVYGRDPGAETGLAELQSPPSPSSASSAASASASGAGNPASRR